MRVKTIACAGALGALLLAAASAGAEDLRLAHWVPPQHPLQPTGLEPWAQSIKQASDGRITITIFPAQQLGAAPDHYDMARDGIADISFVNPGYQAGRFPIIAHGEIPFYFTNAKGGSKALDQWYREYADAGDGRRQVLHGVPAFARHLPFEGEADAAGGRRTARTCARRRARSGASSACSAGRACWVPAPEARDTLAKGAADAITFPWNSIYIFGIDGITKHHLDIPLYVTTFVLVMNQARYDGMSAADRR